MTDEPLYQLRSIESQEARPGLLAFGSLSVCLEALTATVLADVEAGNRGALRITAQVGSERAVEILTMRVTGDH